MKNDIITQTAPEYFNPEYQNSSKNIYRLSQQGFRYYFTLDGETSDDITFYPSVTTIISNTTPTPYGLKKLMMDLGDSYWDFMNEKAKYGTLLHILIADFFRNGYVNFDEVDADINDYIISNKLSFDTSRWHWDIKKDLLSFLKFAEVHNVKPIATEFIGCYKKNKYRFAGAADLICEMSWEEKGFFGETYKSGAKKGMQKETKEEMRGIAIVDFKSGKSGFFDEYGIQLNMYRKMVAYSLGIEAVKLFNVAPKNWQNNPDYSIKDQTITNAKIALLSELFFQDWQEPKELEIIEGHYINGEEIFKKVPAKEFCFNRIKNNQFKINERKAA